MTAVPNRYAECCSRPETDSRSFTGTGLVLWVLCKRLERGTYSWPKGEEKAIELRPEALAMLTDGIELHGAKMRPWYDRGE